MADNWTTRIDPERTLAYGVKEVHQAAFEPIGWPERERASCCCGRSGRFSTVCRGVTTIFQL
jgi:hypothetical protein